MCGVMPMLHYAHVTQTFKKVDEILENDGSLIGSQIAKLASNLCRTVVLKEGHITSTEWKDC